MTMLKALLKHPSSMCLQALLKQCGSSNARTYVRNVRTNNYSPWDSYLTLGNARRGAAKFHQISGKS